MKKGGKAIRLTRLNYSIILVGARFIRRVCGGGFECAGGAQASIQEDCFTRLWRAPAEG